MNNTFKTLAFGATLMLSMSVGAAEQGSGPDFIEQENGPDVFFIEQENGPDFIEQENGPDINFIEQENGPDVFLQGNDSSLMAFFRQFMAK